MKTSLRIRILRHYHNFDQHQMAEKLSMTVSEYSKIETGLSSLEPEVSNRMTAIFGLSLDDIKDIPKWINN